MSPSLETAALTTKYPLAGLRTAPLCKGFDEFLRTPSYFVLLGFLTVFSVMRSLELVTYTVFILIGLFVVLLGSDLLPLMPLFILSYITPSPHNNPGLEENTVFSGPQGIYLFTLAGIFAICLVLRLCLDPVLGKKAFLKTKRALLPGILVLGAGYLLAGAFSGYYTANGWRNALFGCIQFFSVGLLYFLLTGGVRWEKAPKEYLAWCAVCVGLVIVGQLMHIYHVNHVIKNGFILRERIYSGWGNYNNIGALLTMTIPFAFQLSCRKKQAWVFELIALLLMGGVIMTCSRGSILVAVAVYTGTCGLMLYKSLGARSFRYIHIAVLVLAVLAVFFFRRELLNLFKSMLDRGLDPGGRETLYAEGWKQFTRFPIFGGSFFPVDFDVYGFSSVENFTAIFPSRWHNTVIQLLASCGIVGLLAYGFHRYQTVRMMLKNPTVGKAFISISLLALLTTSLLDCHFFNVGPVLFYSMALAFAEKANTQTIKQDKTRR